MRGVECIGSLARGMAELSRHLWLNSVRLLRIAERDDVRRPEHRRGLAPFVNKRIDDTLQVANQSIRVRNGTWRSDWVCEVSTSTGRSFAVVDLSLPTDRLKICSLGCNLVCCGLCPHTICGIESVVPGTFKYITYVPPEQTIPGWALQCNVPAGKPAPDGDETRFPMPTEENVIARMKSPEIDKFAMPPDLSVVPQRGRMKGSDELTKAKKAKRLAAEVASGLAEGVDTTPLNGRGVGRGHPGRCVPCKVCSTPQNTVLKKVCGGEKLGHDKVNIEKAKAAQKLQRALAQSVTRTAELNAAQAQLTGKSPEQDPARETGRGADEVCVDCSSEPEASAEETPARGHAPTAPAPGSTPAVPRERRVPTDRSEAKAAQTVKKPPTTPGMRTGAAPAAAPLPPAPPDLLPIGGTAAVPTTSAQTKPAPVQKQRPKRAADREGGEDRGADSLAQGEDRVAPAVKQGKKARKETQKERKETPPVTPPSRVAERRSLRSSPHYWTSVGIPFGREATADNMAYLQEQDEAMEGRLQRWMKDGCAPAEELELCPRRINPGQRAQIHYLVKRAEETHTRWIHTWRPGEHDVWGFPVSMCGFQLPSDEPAERIGYAGEKEHTQAAFRELDEIGEELQTATGLPYHSLNPAVPHEEGAPQPLKERPPPRPSMPQPRGGARVVASVPGMGDAHAVMLSYMKKAWPMGQVGMTLDGCAAQLNPMEYSNTLNPGEGEFTRRNTLVIGPEQVATCIESLPGFARMLQAATAFVAGHSCMVPKLTDGHLIRQPPVNSGTDWGEHDDDHAKDIIVSFIVKLTSEEGGTARSSMIMTRPVEQTVEYPPAAGSAVLFRAQDKHKSVPTPPELGVVYKVALFFEAETVVEDAAAAWTPPLAKDCVLDSLRQRGSGLGRAAGMGIFMTKPLHAGACIGVYTGALTHSTKLTQATRHYAVAGVPERGEVVVGSAKVDVLASVNEPNEGTQASGHRPTIPLLVHTHPPCRVPCITRRDDDPAHGKAAVARDTGWETCILYAPLPPSASRYSGHDCWCGLTERVHRITTL